MPYQYAREPLTADESDRLSNACETPTERLVVWTLLDTELRVGELCGLTSARKRGQAPGRDGRPQDIQVPQAGSQSPFSSAVCNAVESRSNPLSVQMIIGPLPAALGVPGRSVGREVPRRVDGSVMRSRVEPRRRSPGRVILTGPQPAAAEIVALLMVATQSSCSSSSSSNSAKHAGGVQRHSVCRSFAIAPRARLHDLLPTARHDGRSQLEHCLRVVLRPVNPVALQSEVEHAPDRALDRPAAQRHAAHRWKRSYRSCPASECLVK